jgi:hypothetical protein
MIYVMGWTRGTGCEADFVVFCVVFISFSWTQDLDSHGSLHQELSDDRSELVLYEIPISKTKDEL